MWLKWNKIRNSRRNESWTWLHASGYRITIFNNFFALYGGMHCTWPLQEVVAVKFHRETSATRPKANGSTSATEVDTRSPNAICPEVSSSCPWSCPITGLRAGGKHPWVAVDSHPSMTRAYIAALCSCLLLYPYEFAVLCYCVARLQVCIWTRVKMCRLRTGCCAKVSSHLSCEFPCEFLPALQLYSAPHVWPRPQPASCERGGITLMPPAICIFWTVRGIYVILNNSLESRVQHVGVLLYMSSVWSCVAWKQLLRYAALRNHPV